MTSTTVLRQGMQRERNKLNWGTVTAWFIYFPQPNASCLPRNRISFLIKLSSNFSWNHFYDTCITCKDVISFALQDIPPPTLNKITTLISANCLIQISAPMTSLCDLMTLRGGQSILCRFQGRLAIRFIQSMAANFYELVLVFCQRISRTFPYPQSQTSRAGAALQHSYIHHPPPVADAWVMI